MVMCMVSFTCNVLSLGIIAIYLFYHTPSALYIYGENKFLIKVLKYVLYTNMLKQIINYYDRKCILTV